MPNGLFRLRNRYDAMPMQNVELRHQPYIGNTHRAVVSLGRRVSHKQSVCGCVDIDDHHQLVSNFNGFAQLYFTAGIYCLHEKLTAV